VLQAVRTRFSYGGLLFLREQQLQPITKPSGKARKGDWSSPKAWAAVEPSKAGQCEEHCQIIVEMTQAASYYAEQLVAALRSAAHAQHATNDGMRRTTRTHTIAPACSALPSAASNLAAVATHLRAGRSDNSVTQLNPSPPLTLPRPTNLSARPRLLCTFVPLM